MSKKFYKALGVTETWPKLSLVHPSSITYADVTLLQQFSKVVSRSELDISTKFGPYTLDDSRNAQAWWFRNVASR
jgi:hypothetical protein